MIADIALRLLLVVLLGLVVLTVAERFNPTPTPLLVQADYSFCQTIRPPSLLRTPNGRVDYRLGKPSNDRGET